MTILDLRRESIGGLIGGVTANFVLHPFDLLRNRLAVSDGNIKRPKYRSSFGIIKSVIQNHGFRGLYKGVTPSVIGAGLSWGLYFPIYETAKRQLAEYNGNNLYFNIFIYFSNLRCNRRLSIFFRWLAFWLFGIELNQSSLGFKNSTMSTI